MSFSSSKPAATTSSESASEATLEQSRVEALIEKYESESPTRKLAGPWAFVVGVLAIAISVYGLYWTQYSITTQVYRATFLALVAVLVFLTYPINLKRTWARWLVGVIGLLASVAGAVYLLERFRSTPQPASLGVMLALMGVQALAFLLYPLLKTSDTRVTFPDILLAGLSVVSLGYLVQNFQGALQRIVNPTPIEVAMGLVLIVVVLEASRRTTGPALALVGIFFVFYAFAGPLFPEPFDHRGYRLERLVGQNYLTLEGIFGIPLDVAATFIVLFTIYGAVLEYSGAGKFFIDWAFAAMSRSKSGAAPGRTVTLAGFLLGTVSGSGVATTVTLGALTWPMLKKAGYSKEVAGGILSAAGIGATLSPPTLGAAAFLIAEYLQISYLEVLVYASIPTVLYYLSALLMVEADSRRMRTRAVETQVASLRELTLRYGYHFTSLFAVAILMALGQTAFMAVFWSILIAFLLSFLRPETRLTSLLGLIVGVIVAMGLLIVGVVPISRASNAAFWGLMAAAVVALLSWAYQRLRGQNAPLPALILALESGGRGLLSIAATTAVAGLIVSVITLTGLGLKISGQVVNLAGGNVLATILLAAVAVWVLGLAIPVTASYIIAAVMVVPALVKVGVPEPAAHMFVFYYAVLADVTPPTALAPAAAAALTGGKPYQTMLMAWKYCLPGFLVPIMFTLKPEGTALLLGRIGDPMQLSFTFFQDPLFTVWSFFTACVAVGMFAAAFGGWLRREANWLERGLMGLGGLALLNADLATDALGFAILGFTLSLHWLRMRQASQPT